MNYRDLQNISNLSQQILVEGANEEHNVLNRWPYTSPYLQENDSQVCENHQLDEKSVSWDTGRNASGVSPRDAAARRQAQLQSSSNPADKVRASQISSIRGNMRSAIQATGSNKLQSAGPIASERFKNAAIRQRGGSPDSVPVRTVPGLKDANKPAQTRSGARLGGGSSAQDVTDDPNSKPIAARSRDYKVGGSQGYGISGIKLADSYDLYDIILSHLLDEGYAETQEQAEVIMVNMSEGWRESIIEDVGGNQYTPNPIGNAIKAGAGLAKKVLSNPTVSSTINQTLRGNTSSGGYSTKPGDGKPYKDGPLWDGGGPKTSPKPQTKKQPPMRDEPLF
jgi:hypothetical protein